MYLRSPSANRCSVIDREGDIGFCSLLTVQHRDVGANVFRERVRVARARILWFHRSVSQRRVIKAQLHHPSGDDNLDRK